MGKTGKYLLLTCLYFSQGMPYGFFTTALPTYMREQGAALSTIGLSYLILLPWSFKFMWAPLVDARGIDRIGRRKSWIYGLQGAAILLFTALAILGDGHHVGYLLWGGALASLLAATQDIAADGLAVRLLNEKERGIGNGLQYAGYRVGMIFGGGALLIFLTRIQWHGAFLVMAGCLALALIPLLFYREPPPPKATQHAHFLFIVKRALQRPGLWVWLVLIGFYKFGDAMTSGMLRPFMVDIGMSKEEIGILLGTVGFLSALIGALVGGWLTTRLGRYRAIVLFGLIQATGVGAYYLMGIGWLDASALTAVCALEHFTGGMATAALFTAMMDVSQVESASTDYTLQASVVVIFTGVANVLSGFVAEDYGYNGNFLISTVLCLAGALLFAWRYRNQSGPAKTIKLA